MTQRYSIMVLLSLEAYHRLRDERTSFWERYTPFRETLDHAVFGDDEDPFQFVRDSSAGRDVRW